MLRSVPPEVLAGGAEDPEHLDVMLRLGFSAAVVVPIVSGDRRLGALAIANERGRQIEDTAVALAEDLGARAGAAVLNAQLYAERAHVAASLEAALVAGPIPTTPALEFATRSRTPGTGVAVGGDFTEVLDVGDRWVVAIGDVCGKGAEAAGVTGVARTAIRALAPELRRPSDVLRRLNRLLVGTGDDDVPRFATACLASLTVDGDGVDAVLCGAGHPAPIVLRAGGSCEVLPAAGDLLGVLDDPALADVPARLQPGDALVLYTDGIVEQHRSGQFFDQSGLVDAITSAPTSGSADDLADAVLDAALAFLGAEPGDDMAVAVVRVPPG